MSTNQKGENGKEDHKLYFHHSKGEGISIRNWLIEGHFAQAILAYIHNWLEIWHQLEKPFGLGLNIHELTLLSFSRSLSLGLSPPLCLSLSLSFCISLVCVKTTSEFLFYSHHIIEGYNGIDFLWHNYASTLLWHWNCHSLIAMENDCLLDVAQTSSSVFSFSSYSPAKEWCFPSSLPPPLLLLPVLQLPRLSFPPPLRIFSAHDQVYQSWGLSGEIRFCSLEAGFVSLLRREAAQHWQISCEVHRM